MSGMLVNSFWVKVLVAPIVFIVPIIIIEMSWGEYKRTKRPTFAYLTLAFGVLSFQTLLTQAISVYSLSSGHSFASTVLPILNHFMQISFAILLSCAFASLRAGLAFAKKFMLAGLSALILVAAIVWAAWQNALLTTPGLNFEAFWGDKMFALWSLGLMLISLLIIEKSQCNYKNGFRIAVSIMGIKDLAHLGYLTFPSLLSWLGNTEILLTAVFCYLVFKTIYKQNIIEIEAMNEKNNIACKKLYYGAIRALVTSLDAKDHYTGGHSERVTDYAIRIAQKLGLSEADIDNLYYGAVLHDIGKIGVPEAILTKKGKLTPEEFENIKKHPQIGAKIVGAVTELSQIVPIVLCHHERYDGHGYPMGLKENEAPIEAQIVAVADSFDAMTTERTYRPAKTYAEAANELVNCKGGQFNPDVVDAMLEVLLDDELIKTNVLENAEEDIVVA